MKTSDRGRAFIAAHEGIVTRAYRDSVGVWTIGVGHTSSAGAPAPIRGMTISRSEAMAIFARDLAKFEKRVEAALGIVPQYVFDGAVSFDFNTGAINRATWVKHYRAGRLADARRSFMDWRKPPEIIGRRTDECRLVFDGFYDAHGGAAVEADPPAIWTTPMQLEPVWRQLYELGVFPVDPDGPASALQDWQRANGLEPDGVVGRDTLAIPVRAFQEANDLVVDGKVGKATRTALDAAVGAAAPDEPSGPTEKTTILQGSAESGAAAVAGLGGLWAAVSSGDTAIIVIGCLAFVAAAGFIVWKISR